MKLSFPAFLRPLLPAVCGALGLILRLRLDAATDAKGLLPDPHPVNTALYILAALTLGSLLLLYKSTPTATKKAPPALAAWTCIAAGIGLLACAYYHVTISTIQLAPLAAVASFLGALTFFAAAAMKFHRLAPPYWIYALITMILMVNTVAQCQVWGALPQLQEYFYPLLAAVFCILTFYHKTLVAAGRDKSRPMAFFSQGAMFFSFASLNTPQWPMLLGLLIWVTVQTIPFQGKEA